jgi:hypothetical protein
MTVCVHARRRRDKKVASWRGAQAVSPVKSGRDRRLDHVCHEKRKEQMSIQAIDYTNGLNNAFASVATFIPKLVSFLVVLIIGYIVAKVLSKVVAKVLERVGFDRAVERGGIKKALERSKYDASDILGKLVFYAIMLFVLSTAFGVFGNNPISVYLKAVIAYLPLVFVAILIIVIAAAVAAAVKTLIEGSLGGLSYGKLLANAASALILALGVIAALNQVHIAENVVNAVLYAALAAIVGVVIVSVGGGGIMPMRSRWENTLAKYDEEKPAIAAQARQAPSVKDQAQQAASRAQSSSSSSTGGSTVI